MLFKKCVLSMMQCLDLIKLCLALFAPCIHLLSILVLCSMGDPLSWSGTDPCRFNFPASHVS